VTKSLYYFCFCVSPL